MTESKKKLKVRFRLNEDEKGISLLEVLFSIVVIGIIVVGYVATLGTAVSTNEVVADMNVIASLAFDEVERLRSLKFGDVPFAQTSDPDALKEVPNYIDNIVPDLEDAYILSTGDLSVYSVDYPREAGADGNRANDTTLKWVAARNLLTYGVSEGPDASGPWNLEGPGGSGGDDDGPGGSGPGVFPDGYQLWMVNLGAQQKISRVIYDNRFNIFESGMFDLDEEIHIDDVWQKNWRIFFRESSLELGEPFDPRSQGETLMRFFNGKYGSTGLNIVWDWNENETPLYAGLIGVTEIDTYADFDPDFHWPYVNELEVYGFSEAAEYVPEHTQDGETTYHNIIMYFPNYNGSAFDMGRRSYVPAKAMADGEAAQQELLRVEIEFYTHDRRRNTDEWMRKLWWQEDDAELSRFTTSFYRDRDVMRDNLPLLPDLPEHTVYFDNEDFFVEYTVPDAIAMRFYFAIFDLPDAVFPALPTDYLEFYDKEGNLYGQPQYYGRPGDTFNLEGKFGPWVDGDTIVLHFHSDGVANSLPPELYAGYKVGRVEIRKLSPF